MDSNLTWLIDGTVCEKAYRTKVQYVGTVRFKNWTEVRYADTVWLKVRGT